MSSVFDSANILTVTMSNSFAPGLLSIFGWFRFAGLTEIQFALTVCTHLVLASRAPHEVVWDHGLAAACALMRRCDQISLAIPRSATPIASRIQARNLHDSVSWLYILSNDEHFILLCANMRLLVFL